MFLVYPPGNIGTEIVGLFFMAILQYVKLNNANTANKTELKAYHFYTLLYSIPSAGFYIYYFYFQVYILTFDFILCIIGMVFILLEVVFTFVPIFTLKRKGINPDDNEFIFFIINLNILFYLSLIKF